MATLDNQDGDRVRNEEASPSSPEQWKRPLLMAALGLVLMLGGYAATNYVPVAARLAIYGGLVLFVTAGVLMYRCSPPSEDDKVTG